jgi:hypothetical protein
MSPKAGDPQRASEILVRVVKREHLPRMHRITRSLENCCGIRRCDPHWMSYSQAIPPAKHAAQAAVLSLVFSSEAVGVSGKFACAHGIWEHQNLGTLRGR